MLVRSEPVIMGGVARGYAPLGFGTTLPTIE